MEDEKTVIASRFKAECLAMLDHVAATRVPIIITKRGRPIARLVPIQEATPTDGSVTLLAEDDEAYFSTGEVWDAQVG